MNRHRRLAIILPLLFLFVSACVGDVEEIIKNRLTADHARDSFIETDSFRGVIFTAAQISANTYWPGNDDPWTPSEADVLAMEEQLSPYLQDEYPALWQKLERYTGQYWGTAAPNGNRAIYANYFCDAERLASFLDWQTDLVEILDGGDCYFQTLYDVQDNVFIWLAINGES